MKKKKSKILVLLLFVGLCIGFSIEPVLATSPNDRFYEGEYISGTYFKKVKNGVGRYETARFLKRSDGKFVYCLQPFVEFVSGKLQTAYDEDYALVTGLTEAEWNRITLLAYYGYQYQNHTETKWYAITQLLIWKTVDSNSAIYFTDTLNGNPISRYETEIAELEQLIANHEVYPDFGKQNIILSPGQTVTLTDSNRVLEKFVVTNDSEILTQVSGNQLMITAKYYGTYPIVLTKKDTLYDVPPIVYIATEGQDVFTVGSYTPLQKQLTVEVSGGKIRLKKVDNETTIAQGDATLMGAIYEVYDDNQNLVSILQIDEKQTAETEMLPYGIYTIKETKNSTGYQLNPNVYTVTLDSSLANVTVEEEVIKGRIEIHKIDPKTESCKPQGEASLVGAVYGVYNSSNELVDQVTIDSNCTGISKYLPYGLYDIRELSSSKGYYVSGERHSIWLQEERMYSVISKEPIIENMLEIYKFYGKIGTEMIHVEANASFEIFDNRGQLITTITTNEFGYASVKLPYGNYILHQRSGIDGYDFIEDFALHINETSHNLQTYHLYDGIVAAKLKVTKIDSSTRMPISKAKFRIKNLDTNTYVCQTTNKTICEFETNEEGIMITPLLLESGNYLLEEIEAPYGYLLSNPIRFSIRQNDVSFIEDELYGPIYEIVYENTPVVGSIEIYKSGEKVVINDNKFHYESMPLMDVQYGVYDKDGNLLEVITTNQDGYASSSFLPLGTYVIREIKSANNHMLDEKEYSVELSYVDSKTPIILSALWLQNSLPKGKISIQKIDNKTRLGIPNTKLAIYTEDNQCVYQGLTDEDGIILLNDLWIGKFYIIELESASGYQVRNEKIDFEIKENGEVVEVIMENEKIGKVLGVQKEIEVPDTLLAQHNPFHILHIFYFVGSFLIFLYEKK